MAIEDQLVLNPSDSMAAGDQVAVAPSKPAEAKSAKADAAKATP